jgi:hypothetical protein
MWVLGNCFKKEKKKKKKEKEDTLDLTMCPKLGVTGQQFHSNWGRNEKSVRNQYTGEKNRGPKIVFVT